MKASDSYSRLRYGKKAALLEYRVSFSNKSMVWTLVTVQFDLGIDVKTGT